MLCAITKKADGQVNLNQQPFAGVCVKLTPYSGTLPATILEATFVL